MSRIIAFGEIMARFTTPGFQRYQQSIPGAMRVNFAGAEANVAVSIAQLGGEAAFVTSLPKHPIADACVADLRSCGVDIDQVVRTSEGRLGLFFCETGINQRAGQVIYDRDGSAAAITPASAYDWDRVFRNAEWFVISGITPALSRNAAEVTRVAIDEARKRNVTVVCDLNFRSKLWRWDPSSSPHELAARTMASLATKIDLLVCGRNDAERTLGLKGGLPLEEIPAGLVERFPNLRLVAMTRRSAAPAIEHRFGGLLYDAAAGDLFHAPGQNQWHEIRHAVDRIGGGDAFTAGLVFALATPELSDRDCAIRFAVAAGCLAHSIEGDFNFSTRDEVEELANGEASGRIRR